MAGGGVPFTVIAAMVIGASKREILSEKLPLDLVFVSVCMCVCVLKWEESAAEKWELSVNLMRPTF